MVLEGTKRLSVVLAVGAIAWSGQAWAAGFQLNDHGTSSMGRGNATIATVKDASAVYYNPAGLAGIKGTQFYFGATMISPSASYEGVGPPSVNLGGQVVTEEADSTFVPVPHAYLARELNSKVTFGFGFYLPYGLGNSWDNPNFIGRTYIQEIDLRTFFLTPAVGFKLSDSLSVGASVSIVPATVYLRRVLGSTDTGQILFPKTVYETEGTIELAGSGLGVGANAGLQLSFDSLKIGFGYRSAINIGFTGSADFQLPEGVPAEIAARFPDGPVDAEVTLPHTFNLAVGWVDGPLTLEGGAQLTTWETYDELRINFTRGLPARTSASPRNWKNSLLFKAGGQYMASDSLALRAGAGYDISGAPDETVEVGLPDRDRLFLALGFGYDFGPAFIDAAYTGLLLMGRESATSLTFFPGKYPGGFAHLIGISIGLEM